MLLAPGGGIQPDRPPRIDIVGLGPAGADLVTAGTRELLVGDLEVYLRTARHPAADLVPDARTFDHLYETADSFDEVYDSIVAELVEAARCSAGRRVVYAVPGSPDVAERTVVLLRNHALVRRGDLAVVVHPALSFLDLAFARMGVDPVEAGVLLVDGTMFAAQTAGQSGPLLVAQCWDRLVLSEIKLAVDGNPSAPVTILHHLGLDDERIFDVDWSELDRSFEPDHLTSLWIPRLATPLAYEMVKLEQLMVILREQCPWDQEQTHGSLARHLLEESYETLEAIDALAAFDDGVANEETTPGGGPRVNGDRRPHSPDDGTPGGRTGPSPEERLVADLEEELGDLLFQVYFHARLAAEAGRFDLADVARGVHDKLVSRHPHVFGDETASSADDVASGWEARKLVEKQRSSVTEGIPRALPALALMAKLQRKAKSVGIELPDLSSEATRVEALSREVLAAAGVVGPVADAEGGSGELRELVGELLDAVVGMARLGGVDPETALRARAARFRGAIEEVG